MNKDKVINNNDKVEHDGDLHSLYFDGFNTITQLFENSLTSSGIIHSNSVNISSDTLGFSPTESIFGNLNHESSTTTTNTNEDNSRLELYKAFPGQMFTEYAVPRTYTNDSLDSEAQSDLSSLKTFQIKSIFNDYNDADRHLNTTAPSNIFFPSEDVFSDTMDKHYVEEKITELDTETETSPHWKSNPKNKFDKVLKNRRSITKEQLVSRINSNHEHALLSESSSSSITNLHSSESSISIPPPLVKKEESDNNDGEDKDDNNNNNNNSNDDDEEGIVIKPNKFAFNQLINREKVKSNSFPTTSDVNIGQYKTEVYSDVDDEGVSPNCLPEDFEDIADLYKIRFAHHRCEGCFKISKQGYGCSKQLIKKLPNLQAFKEYNTPNGYTLDYVREHASSEYIYLYSEVTNDYDPLIKRYSTIPPPASKGKKMKRDYPSLCPFCEVTDHRKIDDLFYERNNSCYRGHLINTHGINSTGDVVKLPTSGFVCYKLGKNCWIETSGFRCPYDDCKACFLRGDKTHGFHEYIRHWNRFHIK